MPIFLCGRPCLLQSLIARGRISVHANGYGSHSDSGGFGGTVCYEQYYDLMECLRQVDRDYRNDLNKANDRLSKCSMLCTLAVGLGGGLGCFGLGVLTSGLGAAPCYYKAAAVPGWILYYAACRAD